MDLPTRDEMYERVLDKIKEMTAYDLLVLINDYYDIEDDVAFIAQDLGLISNAAQLNQYWKEQIHT